jgi:hypothetical protein
MAWKSSSGRPQVREQRDKWVVRIDGIDTASGKEPAGSARYLRVQARCDEGSDGVRCAARDRG